MALPFLLLLTFLSSAAAQCNTFTFPSRPAYALCTTLPRLGSTLHWTYRPTQAAIEVAFRCPLSAAGWVAWGLNLNGTRMVGTQALVAVRTTDGSVNAYTTPINSKFPSMQAAALTFNVSGLSAVASGGAVTIFATIALPNNGTTINQVWQASTALIGSVPSAHPYTGDNVASFGTLNLLTGDAAAGSNSLLRRKHVHGILNGISWGVMMPVGVAIARYVRVFESADPAWFYLHVSCQSVAYALGVAGWATGLKLGADSAGVTHTKHRAIGIVLFSLATLQVFALFLRPNKEHKKRVYWNVYHHSIGYSVIVLSVINIFEGFDVLGGQRGWKNAYIIVISSIGGVALLLEIFTWVIVLRRRRGTALKGTNGSA